MPIFPAAPRQCGPQRQWREGLGFAADYNVISRACSLDPVTPSGIDSLGYLWLILDNIGYLLIAINPGG
jgi:hypothetical protein